MCRKTKRVNIGIHAPRVAVSESLTVKPTHLDLPDVLPLNRFADALQLDPVGVVRTPFLQPKFKLKQNGNDCVYNSVIQRIN